MKIRAEVYSGASVHAPERQRLAEHIASLVKTYIRISSLVKRVTVGLKSVEVYVFTEEDMMQIRAAFNSADHVTFERIVSKEFNDTGWLTAKDMENMTTGQLVDYLVQMGFSSQIAKSMVFMSDEEYCRYFSCDPFSKTKTRFDDFVNRIKFIKSL